MKKPAIVLFLLLSAFNIKAQQIQWPRHKKAVIVLTYDDALLSQLNKAVPQLEAAGFKATFFLTGDINYATIPQWRALSKKGFELGNHTVFHPCPSTDDNQVVSDNYTPYAMIREIDVMNHFLFAVNGKAPVTYAYPCAVSTVGKTDYVDTLRKYRLVKYARLGGDTNAVVTDFKHLDLLRIPSYGLNDGTTAQTLIDFVKKVERSGGMGIIMFHGIGAEYLTTSVEAHQQLINYLASNRKSIWVTTFAEAMDYATSAIIKK